MISQYFRSYELPKKRILLLSYSIGEYIPRCCINIFENNTSSHSKVIFIDLSDFKEIKSTETFREKTAQIIELENRIIIQETNNMHLYDKNTLEMIKTIMIDEKYNRVYFPSFLFKIFKFDEHNLIVIRLNTYDNNLIWYEISNNEPVKKSIIKINFKFNYNEILKNGDKRLFILKDKKVILFLGRRQKFIINLNLN